MEGRRPAGLPQTLNRLGVPVAQCHSQRSSKFRDAGLEGSSKQAMLIRRGPKQAKQASSLKVLLVTGLTRIFDDSRQALRYEEGLTSHQVGAR